MKHRENGHVTQDGAIFHITEMLKLQESKLYRRGMPRLIACHICDFDASVLINIKNARQTAKCGNCKNVLKIRILPTGRYKMKSDRGLELIDGNNRYWITKNY